jgi:uncharacterized protein (TIGR01777 family)
MKIVVSGSSGLVGTALVVRLTKTGHEVVRLVRSDRGTGAAGTIHWSPETGEIDTAACERVDAVVHLAGKNIAEKRWTPRVKQELVDSRVKSTRLLCEAMASCERPPRTIVMASATGYYGDRGDEVLREDAGPGRGFLADLCRQWEAAAQPARDKGIRVVILRTGVVLSRKGGALAKLVPSFRLGMGGRLGPGTQYMSWVTLDDLVHIYQFALETTSISGAVNAVSPHAVTNRQFTRALGKALHRPAVLAVPAAVLRMAVGEMADEMLLSSARVVPQALEKHGFQFSHPDIGTALASLFA